MGLYVRSIMTPRKSNRGMQYTCLHNPSGWRWVARHVMDYRETSWSISMKIHFYSLDIWRRYSWIFCFLCTVLFIKEPKTLQFLLGRFPGQADEERCYDAWASRSGYVAALNQWAWELIAQPSSISSDLIVASRTCYICRRRSFRKKCKMGHTYLANPLTLA
jgi:hypothetical protein